MRFNCELHSIDDFVALVMLPYSVIALICISASIGRVPARMKTARSATLIYSDRISEMKNELKLNQ
jgi:hypothetical protein